MYTKKTIFNIVNEFESKRDAIYWLKLKIQLINNTHNEEKRSFLLEHLFAILFTLLEKNSNYFNNEKLLTVLYEKLYNCNESWRNFYLTKYDNIYN